jgi:DNA-binding beta-propeller fold protein YncE
VTRTLRAGKYPEGLDVQPAIGRAYVSNEGDPGTDKNSGHTISVINLKSGRIVDAIPTHQGPDGVAYDQNTGAAYVSNEDQGLVTVIELPPRDR